MFSAVWGEFSYPWSLLMVMTVMSVHPHTSGCKISPLVPLESLLRLPLPFLPSARAAASPPEPTMGSALPLSRSRSHYPGYSIRIYLWEDLNNSAKTQLYKIRVIQNKQKKSPAFETILISLVPNAQSGALLKLFVTSAWVLNDHFCNCRSSSCWSFGYLRVVWSLQQQDLLSTARLIWHLLN